MTYSARFIEEPPELTPRHAAMFYAHCNNTVGDNPFAKAYPVDAGVATSCGALPLGGTPVFRCWDM